MLTWLDFLFMFMFLFGRYSISMSEIWFKNSTTIIPWFWKIKQYFLFCIFEDVTPKEQFLSPCTVRCQLRFKKILSLLSVGVEVNASLQLSAACTRSWCWWCWPLITAAKFCWEEIGSGSFKGSGFCVLYCVSISCSNDEECKKIK